MNCVLRIAAVCLCVFKLANGDHAFGHLRGPDEKWTEIFLLCVDLVPVVESEAKLRAKSAEIATLKLREELIRYMFDPSILLPGSNAQFGHVNLPELAFKRAPDLESAGRYRETVLHLLQA